MTLVCFHIRETQLFHPGLHDLIQPGHLLTPAVPLIDPELLFSLPGFIVALTACGKLAYISENVSHFLGYSVVELLAHGDSIFDILNSSACRVVEEKLRFAQEHVGTEIEVTAEMRISRVFQARFGKNRSMVLGGRFITQDTQLTSSSPALTFVAFCTPVASVLADGDGISHNFLFQSKHTLDMKITEITENVVYYLGYQREELIGQSWYTLLHPEDTRTAAEMHRSLTYGAQRQNQHIVVRLLCKDLTWTWVQVSALKEKEKERELIISTNHVLSEGEAIYIQSQDPQHGVVPPVSSKKIYCYGEINQQTKLNEASLSPQKSNSNGGLKYYPSQLPDAVEEKILSSSLQAPFQTTLPVFPTMGVDAATLQSSQETRSPFFSAGFPCPDRGDTQVPMNPCLLCSTETAFPPHSGPSVDHSPLFEEEPITGTLPTVGTRPDPDNMLAEQIHSLTETFSQYTKQIPQESPSCPVPSVPGQPTEVTHTVSRQTWETNGALDFLEELSVDEDIITNILNNLLHNESLNQSTSELASSNNFPLLNTGMQLSLLQAPFTEATPCLDQNSFLRPFSCSSNSHHMLDYQWDQRFHTILEQGLLPEKGMPC